MPHPKTSNYTPIGVMLSESNSQNCSTSLFKNILDFLYFFIPVTFWITAAIMISCSGKDSRLESLTVDSKKSVSSEVFSGDIFNYFFEKPDALKLIGCKQGQGQVLFEALYCVQGKNAVDIESLLTEQFLMSPLSFVCCGWEPEDGKSGILTEEFHNESTGEFIGVFVNMYSQETLLNKRSEWRNIDSFFVRVEVVSF